MIWAEGAFGKGVEKDSLQAMKCFQQAVAQGHQLATEFLLKLEEEILVEDNDSIFDLKFIVK